MKKVCEFCGKEFEVSNNKHEQRKRFCNTSCSARWRNATFGPNVISEETKKKNAEILRNRWKDPEFRARKIQYMKENNPVYKEGVIEKANKTRLSHGPLPNNYKAGNGKISKYEQIVFDKLKALGFYYNYAINTKLARDAFPEKHYSNNYKPDFVHLKTHLCIEIDGNSHNSISAKETDAKKEECLKFLGFTIIRFTHKQIDEGEFDKWLNLYRKNN